MILDPDTELLPRQITDPEAARSDEIDRKRLEQAGLVGQDLALPVIPFRGLVVVQGSASST
jgi:hypothetical protein